MPSKQIYVKPYVVKGHYRTIHTRTFKFICANCDDEATRTTYATTCPKYCDKCKDLKKKLGKKKQTSGEVIITSVDSQAIETQENIQPPKQVNVELDSAKLIKYINQLLKNNYNKKLNSSEIEILIDLWNQKEYDEIAYDHNYGAMERLFSKERKYQAKLRSDRASKGGKAAQAARQKKDTPPTESVKNGDSEGHDERESA